MSCEDAAHIRTTLTSCQKSIPLNGPREPSLPLIIVLNSFNIPLLLLDIVILVRIKSNGYVIDVATKAAIPPLQMTSQYC